MSIALPIAVRSSGTSRPVHRWLAAAAGTAAVLGVCAAIVQRQTRRAEQAFPPRGRFVTVDGVRLHFTVRGRDDAPQTVVLLHGNGTMAEDFDISGLAKQASERYRIIVFDRPGYGHSERPLGRRFGPVQQADLIHAALTRLGVVDPVVLGHSFGALVALLMGLRHPRDLGSLVLVSGYYFPSLRLDVPLLAGPALPVVGALLRHTLSPLLSRLFWPALVKRQFSPAAATPSFKQRYPVSLALRPSQLRASASDMVAQIRAALAWRDRYRELQVPAVLVAGAGDRQLSTRWHSSRLHGQLERSWLRVIEGSGHMVHHTATPQLVAAIDQAAGMVWDRSLLLRPPMGLKAGEEPGQTRGTTLLAMPCATPAPLPAGKA